MEVMMMNKLEKLIHNFCPDGVEFCTFKEVMKYEQPTKYIVKNTDYNDSFETPVLTAGQTFILGYTNEKNGIYNASKHSPVIIFDDFTGAFKWIDFPFKVKSSAIKILTVNESYTYTTLRYVYHVMGKIAFSSNEHKRLWIGIYSSFQLPLPPLPIQEEIVRILDNFTELTAKLIAELSLRKKQYEYYRDELFNIDKKTFDKLGNLCDLKAGATPKTSIKEYWDNGTIPWMSSGEVNLKKIYKTEKCITHKGYDNSSTKLIPKESVIVALAGQGKTRGTVAMNMIPLCTNQSLCSLICGNRINPYFLYYYLQTQYENLRYISSGDGNRGGLNLKMLSSYMIPVPSLEEQQRIVDILDRFDKLCNDISEGLPAEIVARQKQYEYYRDKLLTFKPLEEVK